MDGKGDTVSSSCTEINEDTINTGVGNGEEGENLSYQKEIIKRIQTLREIMYSLKEQLRDEKELWRKEIDELSKMQYEENLLNYNNIEPSVLCSSESVSSSLADKKMSAFNETTMTVYEKHLQRCHDSSGLLAMSPEYRQQMRRQLAAHSYKRRLMEVERMCNIELARVKQTASYLEPLNKIASEWNLPQNETYKHQKFLSAGDLHYAKSNQMLQTPDVTENQFQLSSTSSVLPPSCSVGQLSVSGCDQEQMSNVDCTYDASSITFTDREVSSEPADMINNYCECDDLSLRVHNKLWTN